MKKFIFALIVCSFVIYLDQAHAAFQLTVTPQTSRVDINFGRIQPDEQITNQEVQIAVANDTGAQYRIIQQMNQPLTNQMGDTISETEFLVYAAQKTASGIYGIEIPKSVATIPVDIYTSDSSGQGVSFIAVYGLNISSDTPAGRYTSSLTYTLQPLTSAKNILEQSVTLNVLVEIEPVLEMKISPVTGRNKLNFRYTGKEEEPISNEVTIEVKSNLGSKYQIYQQLSRPLTDETGNTISYDNLTFYTSGSVNGILPVTAYTPVSNQQTVIYTSDDNGSSASFSIYYSAYLMNERAGSYSGVLAFTCQPQEATTKEITGALEIFYEVEPVFKLSITSPEGQTGINFGHLKENTRQTRSLTLQVTSNLGKQYQIIQEVSGRLINRKGIVMPEDNFQVSTEGGEKGTTSATSPVPVKEGQTVLYVSNPSGELDEITVVYQLLILPDTAEGDYSTGISYSLSTL